MSETQNEALLPEDSSPEVEPTTTDAEPETGLDETEETELEPAPEQPAEQPERTTTIP
jgi:hypothetical protein